MKMMYEENGKRKKRRTGNEISAKKTRQKIKKLSLS